MKKLIISAIAAAFLSFTMAPAFSAPGDHDLKTAKGVKEFFEEQQNRGGD